MTDTASTPERGASRRVLAFMSVLMAFASISTDLYLPALPSMADALHASAGQAEFTISGYLLGFSLTQLVWGPVSDRYGRRPPLAIGLVLFIIGSAGCALASSGAELICSRILQAMGACAGVVLARAMVRDFYPGHRAAQMLSLLLTIMAVAPLIGPLIGAQILALLGWRAIFCVLIAVGCLTLMALQWIPESLPPDRRNMAPLKHAVSGYAQLLKSRQLLAYAGAGGFFFGGTFAYIAGSPFAYITYYHLPPQMYGVFFGAGIVGLMGLNMLNTRFIPCIGSDRMMLLGAICAAVAGAGLIVDALLGLGGIFGLALPLFVFVSVTGLIWPIPRPAPWLCFPAASARCLRWPAASNTDRALRDPCWSAPWPTARLCRWP